jgi:hypothetical protein
MIRRLFKGFFLGLVVLLVLAAVDYWLFKVVFHLNYFRWYLDNGAVIGLITSITTTVWGDINKNTNLISANPTAYLGANLLLVSLPAKSLGANVKEQGENLISQSKESSAIADRLRTDPSFRYSPIRIFRDVFLVVEALISIIFVILINIGLAAWLLLVMPLQYLTFLICGAPVRAMMRSGVRTIAKHENEDYKAKIIRKTEELPEGWWDASFEKKPISLTNLFAAFVFLVLKFGLAESV